MKKEIFCTLGPSSINSKFLKFVNKNKVDLLRVNMSHVSLSNLSKIIKFVRKHTRIPICIDTEGAQIRTKTAKKKFFKALKIFKISKIKGSFNLYPFEIFDKLKKGDILDIGFTGLEVKILSKNNEFLKCKVLKEGYYENNKGVHLKNRKIKISYLIDGSNGIDTPWDSPWMDTLYLSDGVIYKEDFPSKPLKRIFELSIMNRFDVGRESFIDLGAYYKKVYNGVDKRSVDQIKLIFRYWINFKKFINY